MSCSFQGGSSKVDILICTPGRLIDHLSGSRNFTLQHLRFLVVDEADRLLAQSFQDWLARVLSALRPHTSSTSNSSSSTTEVLAREVDEIILKTNMKQEDEMTQISSHDAVAPFFLHSGNIQTDLDDPKHSSCQKLLFSATLTRDPARIAALGLRDPKYFVVQGKDSKTGDEEQRGVEGKEWALSEGFAMPAGLQVCHLLLCKAQSKFTFAYYRSII